MDPRSRNGLIIGGASVLALWIGGALAGGDLTVPVLAALACVALLIAWSRLIRLETALLAFVLAGYLIGNRGFAQITASPRLPLLFGEAVLAITGLLLLVRCAFRREAPWRNDGLNGVLLLLVAFGAARMVVDFRAHGLWALRDFATIYYIAYFFIAQAIAEDPRERRRLELVLLGVAAVLPFVALLFQRMPDLFVDKLTLRGIPVIFMKDDLAATFLLALSFPLLARASSRAGRIARAGIGGIALLVGLALLSRAAIVGFVVAGGFALMGWQFRWVRVAAIALPLGAFAAIGTTLAQEGPWRESRVYALYEHMISIGDLDGRGSYQSSASTDSGDNNRFRLIWWQAITERVIEENPVFGLGFGYDLSRDFVSVYQGVSDDFNVRSPHSVIFTLLGRTGFLGLSLFLGLIGILVARTRTAARAARAGHDGAPEALAWWCACWVILVSACFGVVLENPMGAVVLWSLVGLAHASTRAVTERATAAESTETHDPSLQTTAEPAIR